MKKFTEEKEKRRQAVKVRIGENLLNETKEKAKILGISLSSYVNFVISSAARKGEVLFEEKINKYENKKIKSRIALTESEVELLKSYAQANDWSLPKELRYRIVATLAKKPKLSREELKAVYSVRFSINILGADINRLVANKPMISEYNHVEDTCKELLELIRELINKIDYLEKCSHTHFKLKAAGRNI